METKSFIEIPQNQMNKILGGEVVDVNKKINYCSMCAQPLSDKDMVEVETGSGKRYRYTCPCCGSGGIV